MVKPKRIRQEISDDNVLTIGPSLVDELGESEVQIISTLDNNEKKEMSMKKYSKKADLKTRHT